MVRKFLTAAFITAALATAACNTVRGAAADVNSAANTVDNAT
jgi:predicted small secreted protein